MSQYNKDSIVALATARGVGALSIVRVSGELSSNVFKSLTGIKNIRSRYAYYSVIKSKNGVVLDDAIAIFYKEPNSFTGEESFEITCHGGEVVANNIINEILHHGCRYANPGEFSKRAVLNGKISLERAEALNSSIKATSRLSAEKGLMGLKGEAKKLLQDARNKIIRLLAVLEHELDFVEGEIDETSDISFIKALNEAIAPLKEVSTGTLIGNKLKSGFRVALIGPPNVGKSTLFNALLGYDRSLISSIKGTTRDSLEVFVEIEGVPVELIDTAGYWDVRNKLDALGVKKTQSIIKTSDILMIVDEESPILFSKKLDLFDKPCLFVKSKCDEISEHKNFDKTIKVSSHKRINLDILLTTLSTLIKTSFLNESVFVCSSRQATLIKKTLLSLNELTDSSKSLDLVQRVSALRNASESLFDVYGEISNDDVLNNVFQSFCVGK